MLIKALEIAFIRAYDRARAAILNQREQKTSGLYIGEAAHPYVAHVTEPAYLAPRQHLYVVGASGSGKTKSIEGLIHAEIQNDRGFGVLDFHGDLARNILKHLAAKAAEPGFRRSIEDGRLVFIKPSDPDYAVGFNPLWVSKRVPAYSVALELLAIVRKIWGDFFGPRMEEIMRNLFVALAEAGETLDAIPPFLTDTAFRESIVARVTNPEVRHYWTARYARLSEGMKATSAEPVLNKITAFLTDPNILAMVGQKKNTLDLRRIMDTGGWLIIDLSKGELKENAFLLGGFFLAKIKEAAFSRGDVSEHRRKPFSLYLDEFQNIASEDFVEILTEARKYRLFFRLAHQHLAQMNRNLLAAILGNVGALLSFRLGDQDARVLGAELDQKAGRLWEARIPELSVGEAVLKRRGESPRLVRIQKVVTPEPGRDAVEAITRMSLGRYGRRKTAVLREIESRREAMTMRGFSYEVEFEKDRDNGTEGQNEW